MASLTLPCHGAAPQCDGGMPVVSVIMAFHRVTPHLRPAVRSILNQTFSDWELMLVDNGTGLGLAALGDEGRDPRIRLLSLPTNEGIAAAHNLALARSTGELIALMDYDDVALQRRFERQVAEFRAEPTLGLLFTHALAIDEEGRVIEPQFSLTTERELRVFSAYSMPATPPTLMARREVFTAVLMRLEFWVAPDYDLFSRAVELWPARTLPEVLFHYRRHEGQTTVVDQSLQVQNASRVRLLTARRRSGRPETTGTLAAEFSSWRERPPASAVTYAEFARRSIDERFPLLAVYFARRLLSVRRDFSALTTAATVLIRALGQNPGDAVTLLRMFFTGPLRTHRLRQI